MNFRKNSANEAKLLEPFVVPKSTMSLISLHCECVKVGAFIPDGDGSVLLYRFGGADYVLRTQRIPTITRFYASVDELHAANGATPYEG